MTLYLFARFHVPAERKPAFFDAVRELREPTEREAGCLRDAVFHCVRDEGEFYIHSLWQNRAAFDWHAGRPYTVRFLTSVEALSDQPVRISLTAPVET